MKFQNLFRFLALVASVLSLNAHPFVPLNVAAHGVGKVVVSLGDTIDHVSMWVDGESVVGQGDKRQRDIDATKLYKLGFNGSFTSLRQVLQQCPITDISVVPIQGKYNVYVWMSAYDKSGNALFSGSAWVEVSELEDGSLSAQLAEPYLDLADEQITTGGLDDVFIKQLLWVAPNHSAPSQPFWGNQRGQVDLPVIILNAGTLVLNTQENGVETQTGWTLGEGATRISYAQAIAIAFGSMRSGVVAFIESFDSLPDVSFWTYNQYGQILGYPYPVLEYTPAATGINTKFSIPVPVFGQDQGVTLSPDSVTVRDTETKEENLLFPDPAGMFVFSFKAGTTYQLISSFPGVLNPQLQEEGGFDSSTGQPISVSGGK